MKTKKIRDLTIGEYIAVCKANDVCLACPLILFCSDAPKFSTSTTLDTEVEVPEE